MSFAVSYNIKLHDQFSKNSAKIVESAVKVERAMRKISIAGNLSNVSLKKLEASSSRLRDTNLKLNQKLTENSRVLERSALAAKQAKTSNDSLARSKTNLAIAEKRVTAAQRDSLAAMKTTGDHMSRAGGFMLKRVALPMAVAGGFSVKAAFDINKGMATVATLIPGNVKRVQELKSGIQDLAIETGVATSDLTEGAYAAISAWGDSSDTIARLGVVARASKAGVASTRDTLGMLATLTSIWGDTSAEATEKFSDMAFVTNVLAKEAPFAQMAASMGSIAPIAKQIGVSAEDMFSTLTAGAGITGSVSEVTTQMRSLYLSTIKQTPAMRDIVVKANKQMGTSFASASEMIGKMGTLPFLQFLQNNTDGITGMTKALGGRSEGLILATALLNGRMAKYNEAMAAMPASAGATATAYNEVANGINKSGEKWEKTKQKLMVFRQELGEKLLPLAEKFMVHLDSAAGYLRNLTQEEVDAAVSTAKLALKVGLLFIGVGKFLSLASSVSSYFTMMSSGALAANASMTSLNTTTASTVANAGKLQGMLMKGGMIVGAAGFGVAIGGYITEVLDRAENKRLAVKNAAIKEDLSIRSGKFSVDELLAKQEQMRQKMGIHKDTWSRLVSGKRTEEDDNMRRLGVGGLDRLLGGNKQAFDVLNAQIGRQRANRMSRENVRQIMPWEAEQMQSSGGTMGAAEQMVLPKQEVKIKLELTDPGGMVTNLKAKTSDGAPVDLGSNLR